MSPYLGKSLPLSALRDPLLVQAYDYWCARRGARRFPARDDIAPEDMRAFLAQVLLFGVTYDPLDFVYRVFGSGVAAAHGADFSNKSVSEIQPPEFATVIGEQYGEVIARRTPVLHQVIYSPRRRHIDYQRITMPLSTDGEIIDMLLAVSAESGAFWKAQ